MSSQQDPERIKRRKIKEHDEHNQNEGGVQVAPPAAPLSNHDNEHRIMQKYADCKFTAAYYTFPTVNLRLVSHDQLFRLFARLEGNDKFIDEKRKESSRQDYCDWQTVIHMGWHKHVDTLHIQCLPIQCLPRRREMVKKMKVKHHIDIIKCFPILRNAIIQMDVTYLSTYETVITFMQGILPLFQRIEIVMTRELQRPFISPWIPILASLDGKRKDDVVTLIFDFRDYDPDITSSGEMDRHMFTTMFSARRLPWFNEVCLRNTPSTYVEAPTFLPALKQTCLVEYDHSLFPYSHYVYEELLLELPLRRLGLFCPKLSKTLVDLLTEWKGYMQAQGKTIADSCLGRTCDMIQLCPRHHSVDSSFCIDLLDNFPMLTTLDLTAWDDDRPYLVLSDKQAFMDCVLRHPNFLTLYPCPEELKPFFRQRIDDKEAEQRAWLNHALPVEVSDLRELVYQYGEYI